TCEMSVRDSRSSAHLDIFASACPAGRRKAPPGPKAETPAAARSRSGLRPGGTVGKYLTILDAFGAKSSSDKSAKSDKSPPFVRFSRFGRPFSVLEARCPDNVDVDRGRQCVEDGKRFLAKWGEQAEAAKLVERGPIRPRAGPGQAASELPAIVEIRRSLIDLAARRQQGFSF